MARVFKIGMRLANGDNDVGDGTGLAESERDSENIVRFNEEVLEATLLLQREINEIGNGNLNVVKGTYDEKCRIFKKIELNSPLVEPFLASKTSQRLSLPQNLKSLNEVALKNSDLLKRMANAASSIVKEINMANSRQTLSGLYGKTGQKITGTQQLSQKFDGNL